MKIVAGLLMLIVVVAGVAVNASRAAPLAQTSVAFRQCQGGEPARSEACRPMLDPLTLAAEEGYIGDNVEASGYSGYTGQEGSSSAGEPDRWVELARLAVYVADFLINNWDKLFGSGLTTGISPAAAEVVFDPVR